LVSETSPTGDMLAAVRIEYVAYLTHLHEGKVKFFKLPGSGAV